LAANREFYRGRRKRRNYALIPFLAILGLLTVIVVLFYAMQKYAVISDEGVDVVLTANGSEENLLDADEEEYVFAPVEAELVFDPPDYSGIRAAAGMDAKPMRAIYIAAADLNRENILDRAAQLNSGNALLLEMKPREGYLMWDSQCDLAQQYSLVADYPLRSEMADVLKEIRQYGAEQDKQIWLVAQISCCVDALLPTRSGTFSLRSASGNDFFDDTGYWLDPYNRELRNYIVQITQELYDLGFDEVVLADVGHPTVEVEEGQEPYTFIYSSEMSTPPSPQNAVCGFAVYVARQLEDREGLLSIYTSTRRSLARLDEGTGQDAALFLKLYDRVYFRTDRYEFTFNFADIKGSVSIGSAQDRFVPVVINYLPDNTSWVYIEDLESLPD